MLVAVAAVMTLLAALVSWRLAVTPPAPPAASGRTFVVASDGNDRTGDGTMGSPWRTVGRAAAAADAGDRIAIRGGVYDERVTLSATGSVRAPIEVAPFRDERVTLRRGLWVRGSHYRIRDIRVEPGVSEQPAEEETSPALAASFGQYNISGDHNELRRIVFRGPPQPPATGIPVLTFLGSYNTVRDVDFTRCDGISFVGSGLKRPGKAVHNTVDGGVIGRVDNMFANVSADYATIENLDMHDTGQAPRGADADGINLDGAHIAIRHNIIHGVHRSRAAQHTDAIQWWNKADDLLIEGNVIGSFEKGPLGYYDEGHIQWSTYLRNSVTGAPGMTSNRVVIRDNVFLNAGEYYVINASPGNVREGAANDWVIENNTFRCPQPIRTDYAGVAHGWKIRNNIFFTQANDFSAARDWTIDDNAYVGPKSRQDGGGSVEWARVDFTGGDIDGSTHRGTYADWHLHADSPLAGLGARSFGPRAPSR